MTRSSRGPSGTRRDSLTQALIFCLGIIVLFSGLGLLATAILGVALQREDERLALQRRLDEQTDLFKTIFGAMSDGVAVANAKGELVLRNPKAVELAGVG